MYPDLTVKENLIYSGRLNLPAGTSEAEIKELAEETMVSLGLSRIANSLVGDARRRGLSGGEKKVSNISAQKIQRIMLNVGLADFLTFCVNTHRLTSA